MKDDLATKPQIHVAALEHLTGPSRGSIAWFNEAPVDVLLTSDRHVDISPSLPGQSREGLIARIQQTEKGFEIETVGGRHLWINGRPVEHAKIDHLDMIEFGENGPLSRLFVHGEGEQARVSVGEAVSDAIAYFKVSRRPLLSRISNTLGLIMRQLTRETTLLFRISVASATFATDDQRHAQQCQEKPKSRHLFYQLRYGKRGPQRMRAGLLPLIVSADRRQAAGRDS